MSTENRVRWDRMIESGEAVLDHAKAGRRAFLEDSELHDAIMGRVWNSTEEAEKLHRALARENPRIDWRELTQLRQRFHPGYASLLPEDTWEFIDRRFPRLVSPLRKARLTEE